MEDEVISELKRLDFENIIWVIFALLCLLNIFGDNFEKNYLKSHNSLYKNSANKIFEFTLIITFCIYIYFFYRNYRAYKKAKEKKLYLIKLAGSTFFVVGIICLIYFQFNNDSFTSSPAL